MSREKEQKKEASYESDIYDEIEDGIQRIYDDEVISFVIELKDGKTEYEPNISNVLEKVQIKEYFWRESGVFCFFGYKTGVRNENREMESEEKSKCIYCLDDHYQWKKQETGDFIPVFDIYYEDYAVADEGGAYNTYYFNKWNGNNFILGTFVAGEGSDPVKESEIELTLFNTHSKTSTILENPGKGYSCIAPFITGNGEYLLYIRKRFLMHDSAALNDYENGPAQIIQKRIEIGE